MWDKIKQIISRRKYLDKSASVNDFDNKKLTKSYAQNIEILKNIFDNVSDVKFRQFYIKNNEAILVYIDTMVDKNLINDSVLRPLMFTGEDCNQIDQYILEDLAMQSLTVSEVKKTRSLKNVLDAILEGDGLLLVKGVEPAFLLNMKSWQGRGISKPTNEVTTYGPQEAFVENIQTNISMIRKRIRDPLLKVRYKSIGRRGKSKLAMLYIEDIANDEIVHKIEERLDGIDIDYAMDVGMFEGLISENQWTPFPQLMRTERPDRITAGLMEGQVALFLENTPYVYLAPAILINFFQSSEDYYNNYLISSFIRSLRFVAAAIVIFLPPIYISLTAFHHELLPVELIIPIALARSKIPFPSIIEAFIMEAILEIIREAGARLPGPIGQTISIVGGLVIGDAAVRANLVSSPMVIVVAVTAIASFTIPVSAMSVPFRLIRFAIMLLAATLSVYGIILGFLFMLIHVISLESFDVPYFSPLAPINIMDLKDAIVRLPYKYLNKRPNSIPHEDNKRSKGDKNERN